MSKTYKVDKLILFFIITFLVIMLILGFYFLKDNNQTSALQGVIALLGFVFFIISMVVFLKFKVIVDETKIEMHNFNVLKLFSWKKDNPSEIIQSLYWDEILEVTTSYVLFPENPIIILKPHVNSLNKPIEFMIFGLSLKLLKDILSHVHANARVDIYPYLEKMLNKKMINSKFHIIIIGVCLMFLVIGGFLFSRLFWK